LDLILAALIGYPLIADFLERDRFVVHLDFDLSENEAAEWAYSARVVP